MIRTIFKLSANRSLLAAVVASTLFVTIAIGLVSTEASAATKKKVPGNFIGCKSTYTLPHSLFVYKNSAPLRNSRGAMIGLRYEPSLLMKKRFAGGSTTIFDAKGNRLGWCPWASAHGFSGGRMRCTMSTAALRGTATKAGSTKIFMTVGSGNCVEVPDAGRCYGSVKGGCNRTIK